MLLSVLRGSKASQLALTEIPRTLGLDDIVEAREKLFAFIDKTKSAIERYYNKKAPMYIGLGEREIDDLIDLGLDKELLFNVSVKPITILGTPMSPHPLSLDVFGDHVGADRDNAVRHRSAGILMEQAYGIAESEGWKKPNGAMEKYTRGADQKTDFWQWLVIGGVLIFALTRK